MALRLENLDDRTRKFMLEELELDVANRTLYISPRLNQTGEMQYENLLSESIKCGDDSSLADSLRTKMKLTEQRQKPKDGITIAKVPITASDTLAEGLPLLDLAHCSVPAYYRHQAFRYQLVIKLNSA